MTRASRSTAGHPIRAAARLTGLSTDTLRAWERRYAAVTPGRAGRGRTYSDEDIARLKQLAVLVERGYSIGAIAALDDAELARLLDAPAVSQGGEARPGPSALSGLFAALARYDLDAIETQLAEQAAMRRPADLVFSVVVPLLREVGTRWEQGHLRPSQEHLISGIIRTTLGNLLRATTRAGARTTIVFAAPPGERHELGLLCGALLASSAGFGVVYLGADVPAADIAHAARTSRARGIVMAATIPPTTSKADARALAEAADAIGLWIGGPAAGALAGAIGPQVRVLPDLGAIIPALGPSPESFA